MSGAHHLVGGEEQDLTMTICALKLELAESRTRLDEARHANRLITQELEQAQSQINAECALRANIQQRLNNLEKATLPQRLHQCATENTALRVSLECTVAQRDTYKSRCRALMDQNEWMRDAFDRAGLSPLGMPEDCSWDNAVNEEDEDNRGCELRMEPAPAGAGHSSAKSGSVSSLKSWLTANITTRMHGMRSNSLSSSSSFSTRTKGIDDMRKSIMVASPVCSEAMDLPCHRGNSCGTPSAVPFTISCGEETVKEQDVELHHSMPFVAFKRKSSSKEKHDNMPKQQADTERPAQATSEVAMPSTCHENDADSCRFSNDFSLSVDDLPVLRKSRPSSEGGATSETANLGSLHNTYNSNLTCDTMQDVENFLTGSPSISKMLNDEVIIADPESDSLFDDLGATRNKQTSLAGKSILAGSGFQLPTPLSVHDGEELNKKCQMDLGFPRPPAA